MLIIQFPMSDDEDDDDLEFRIELEELATNALGAANLGTCDGGDIGSGTINVLCTVTNAEKACAAIVAAMDGIGLDGALIAYFDDDDEDAEPRVLHPPGYTGSFSVL